MRVLLVAREISVDAATVRVPIAYSTVKPTQRLKRHFGHGDMTGRCVELSHKFGDIWHISEVHTIPKAYLTKSGPKPGLPPNRSSFLSNQT